MNHQEHEEHKGHEEGKVLRLATEALAREVVDAGLKVHKALGPGLLESTYEHCLAHELKLRGIPCQRQVAIPLNYEGMRLDTGYRIDMVADDSIVIEVKSVDCVTKLHSAQLLTYLKLSSYRIGFIMNFNVFLFKDGIRRLIL